MALKDVQIRNAKPREKQYKLFDERGLFLIITPKGKNGGGFAMPSMGKKNYCHLERILM